MTVATNQGLTRHPYLVSLRDDLRLCSEPAPTPAPSAAPMPPPARAPIIDPTAAPPTVLFAVLAPRDFPVNSYSPVATGTVCPVSSMRSYDLPVNVPDSFDSVRRP